MLYHRADGQYDLDFKTENNDGSKVISGEALADMYRDWAKRYPIVSVEDPFDQDDWDSWVKYTASVDHQVVGDDLTVTNPKRIQMGIDKKACNCLLLKVNQVRPPGLGILYIDCGLNIFLVRWDCLKFYKICFVDCYA